MINVYNVYIYDKSKCIYDKEKMYIFVYVCIFCHTMRVLTFQKTKILCKFLKFSFN